MTRPNLFPGRSGLLLSTLTAWLIAAAPPGPAPADKLFDRENLIAWCIVPFDSQRRGPEERAEMLARLGFKHFAYDWRAEHVPTFDAEVDALKRRGIALDAFWVAPGVLNDDSRRILDLLKRHGLRAQLWCLLDLGPELKVEEAERQRRVARAADQLRPLAEEAAKIGCMVALYNHGGWFGEPENQVAIIERLKREGITNLGIVYNLHHGHHHLDRFGPLLETIRPYLLALNLNGMDRDGDQIGRKILPLGQGALDLDLLRIIRASGYRGPIGILGHTQDDAEQRLQDNLDGLDWLMKRLDGRPAGPPPIPRTPVPPRPASPPPEANQPPGSPSPIAPAPGDDQAKVADLLAQARQRGDSRRGAEVFASARFGCLSCHKVGDHGGEVGPVLTASGLCLKPEEIVESFLWPRRRVKEGYEALLVATDDGKLHRGFLLEENPRELVLRDIASGERRPILKEEIADRLEEGSVMPEGLAEAMSPEQRRDLVRFLLDLGRMPGLAEGLKSPHAPAMFPHDRAPLRPDLWPNWQHPVNRDRIYDFYAKEAAYFLRETGPALLPAFPGLDGGTLGHWGNQNEETWKDDRWNDSDLGPVLCGTLRGAGVTVPKGVCLRLGDRGELSVCFNPETLTYEALWRGGFVRFAEQRHGFLGGLKLDGEPLPRPENAPPDQPFVYRGYYRHGSRVIFAYRLGGVEMLDAPWVDDDGQFRRVVAPADTHPLAHLTRGGPPAWPEVLETRGRLGTGRPYAVDTIEPPFHNPWKALLFFGDHDFLPDGSALLSTMQGDVWRVEGLDATLERVRWRRIASGLYHPLGLVVADGAAYVLGRDQITRLHDLNGDGETDFYECVSHAYQTSPGGHDFISGLQRDAQGRFLTASSNQGLLRISADGQTVDVLATGFRNPDGLGLAPDGTVTVPSSEGDWVPASMIAAVHPEKPGAFLGARGPRGDQAPDLPLVYLPRGLDNSSGGQAAITSDRWGPLRGLMVHFSYGMGRAFLVLRDEVDGQPQGAVVPLPGEFLSGSHRGRFHPLDGQLYVTGMGGWGTYTPADGCFQRIRFTGGPVRLPLAWRAHENGVWLRFAEPLDPARAERASEQFAQCWNYRYGPGYGSPEFAPSHPDLPGHDRLAIRSAHRLDDGRSLFLEIPDLQPVNQLHLHLKLDDGEPIDLFATVHKLAEPFTALPGFAPVSKVVAAHPIRADLAALKLKPVPNPHLQAIPQARSITIETGPNLSFATRTFRVRAGEPIRFTLINTDVVPHNWALIRPGTLATVGDLVNRIIAEPDAAVRQYIPRGDHVLAYTDIVEPQRQFTIHFQAPAQPGRYPYLCTFPGHWMVMNGEMIVDDTAP
jgi:putative heme-binding domain-containing protein